VLGLDELRCPLGRFTHIREFLAGNDVVLATSLT
jgi:hypothetical protein